MSFLCKRQDSFLWHCVKDSGSVFSECLPVCLSALSNLAALVLSSPDAAEGAHGRQAWQHRELPEAAS